MEVSGQPDPFTRKLSHAEINLLPVKKWEGPIHLIHRQEDVPGAVAELERERVLGFDTETRPAFRKGVSHRPALLQLAGSSAVWLFQLRRLTDFMPLAGLLGSARLLKVGVGLEQDIKQLLSLFPFEPRCFFDLGEAARQAGLESHGLRSMAASLLSWRISKTAQCSNWGNDSLQPFQISYAATDAWISRELFYHLQRMRVTDIIAGTSQCLRLSESNGGNKCRSISGEV